MPRSAVSTRPGLTAPVGAGEYVAKVVPWTLNEKLQMLTSEQLVKAIEGAPKEPGLSDVRDWRRRRLHRQPGAAQNYDRFQRRTLQIGSVAMKVSEHFGRISRANGRQAPSTFRTFAGRRQLAYWTNE